MKITKLNESTKKNILNDLLKRSPNNYGEFTKTVEDIVNNVRENGDKAVFEYTKKFDGVSLSADNIIVTDEEIQEAYAEIEKDGLVEVIRRAKKNITEYHEKQRQYSWFDSKPDGSILGQKVTALSKAGVYVPG